MALDIAQVEKAKAEAPGLLRLRQPKQQVGDLFVLVVEFRAIAIAGLGVCEILCPDAFSYAMGKRSSNMMASWLLTRCHSRTDRFHSTEVALSAK